MKNMLFNVITMSEELKMENEENNLKMVTQSSYMIP